jgi:sugar O-acyltransferase (sialic acid O-acetyltransferase NeuD family)
MTKIIVFGTGKIADVFHTLAVDSSAPSVAGFTCDGSFMHANEFHGLPVVPFDSVETAFPPADFAMFVAIGYQALNSIRAQRCAQARDKGYRLVSFVGPRACVPSTCRYGENCWIMDGASVQPFARLGNNVFVWNNAVVGHHAQVEDNCWLASNCTVSSTATVGPSCFIGVNAAIGHNLTVGARNILGAGTVITRSTDPDGVYVVRDTERFRLSSSSFARISRML